MLAKRRSSSYVLQNNNIGIVPQRQYHSNWPTYRPSLLICSVILYNDLDLDAIDKAVGTRALVSVTKTWLLTYAINKHLVRICDTTRLLYPAAEFNLPHTSSCIEPLLHRGCS